MSEAAPGNLLANRYCLRKKLGQGGMGSVWVAHDQSLRIEVAVKLIDPALIESSEALTRFEREAHAAAKLRSTHIVHINDYGVDPASQQPFIAMDLLEGESLLQRLKRVGKLTFVDTLHILSQVARALVLAHSRGIVHRDLKPDNIFIAREGDNEVVKVLDFGIAKKLDAHSISGDLKTRAGQLLGTPFYMSPEQAQSLGEVDQRTDVWSFGVIAFECVVGRRPFESDNLAALLLAICSGPIADPMQFADVPVGFDQWFWRAVDRNAETRFPTIAAALAELETLVKAPLTRPGELGSLAKIRSLPAVLQSLNTSLNPSSVTSSRLRVAGAKRWPARLAIVSVPVLGVAIGASWFARTGTQSSPALTTAVLAASIAPEAAPAARMPEASGVAESNTKDVRGTSAAPAKVPVDVEQPAKPAEVAVPATASSDNRRKPSTKPNPTTAGAARTGNVQPRTTSAAGPNSGRAPGTKRTPLSAGI